jgi:hypothetical protein
MGCAYIKTGMVQLVAMAGSGLRPPFEWEAGGLGRGGLLLWHDPEDSSQSMDGSDPRPKRKAPAIELSKSPFHSFHKLQSLSVHHSTFGYPPCDKQKNLCFHRYHLPTPLHRSLVFEASQVIGTRKCRVVVPRQTQDS